MTKRGVVLLVLVSAFSASAADSSNACQEPRADCREDCTMEFGTSVKLRAKLGKCISRCEAVFQECTSRARDFEAADIYEKAPPVPAAGPEATPDHPAPPVVKELPVESSPPEAQLERESASQKPAPEVAPPPPPPPAVTKKAPPAAVVPKKQDAPAPSKKDISDWDPNGD